MFTSAAGGGGAAATGFFLGSLLGSFPEVSGLLLLPVELAMVGFDDAEEPPNKMLVMLDGKPLKPAVGSLFSDLLSFFCTLSVGLETVFFNPPKN